MNPKKKGCETMEHKHAIVIKKNGYMSVFVLVEIREEDGQEILEPYSYDMQPGESFIFEDVPTALGMVKPKWNGRSWEEMATPEELAAAQPEPIPAPAPDPRDLAIAELAATMAANQMQTDMAIAEMATIFIGGVK